MKMDFTRKKGHLEDQRAHARRRTIETEMKEAGYDRNNITRTANETYIDNLLWPNVQKCIKRIK